MSKTNYAWKRRKENSITSNFSYNPKTYRPRQPKMPELGSELKEVYATFKQHTKDFVEKEKLKNS